MSNERETIQTLMREAKDRADQVLDALAEDDFDSDDIGYWIECLRNVLSGSQILVAAMEEGPPRREMEGFDAAAWKEVMVAVRQQKSHALNYYEVFDVWKSWMDICRANPGEVQSHGFLYVKEQRSCLEKIETALWALETGAEE